MKVFKEEQRFTQTWIIVLLLSSTIVPLVIIFNEYFENQNAFTVWELVLIISIALLAPAIIFLFKLYTRIDETGIHYKYFPFHLKFKTILWSDISKAYVRQYDALTEYGGWGLKGGVFWKKSKGIAINVSGDIGIQLELKSGKKVLIGTNLKEDAKNVLFSYKHKIEQEELKHHG